jgi:hypothetical protein
MPNYLRKSTNFKIGAKKFSFLCTKWEDSTLTHFSNSFQVNMFMYRQQLLYLLLFMYSLPYILYMFSPICMWSAALNKPGSVITQGMGGRGSDNKQTNSWILNDLGRNSLLGKRKKIAKFLMRTFTYRSTFLYGCDSAQLSDIILKKVNSSYCAVACVLYSISILGFLISVLYRAHVLNWRKIFFSSV